MYPEYTTCPLDKQPSEGQAKKIAQAVEQFLSSAHSLPGPGIGSATGAHPCPNRHHDHCASFV